MVRAWLSQLQKQMFGGKNRPTNRRTFASDGQVWLRLRIARRRPTGEGAFALRVLADRPDEVALKQLSLSEDEWHGRSVISFALRVLADRPDEVAAVADRLEKELQQLVADRKKQPPRLADPRIKPAP